MSSAAMEGVGGNPASAAAGSDVAIRPDRPRQLEGIAPPRLTRHLMVSGLGFWGVSVGGALAPGALRALLFPNHADGLPFALVAAAPLGATLLWPFLVAWCLSWAFVVGYLSAAGAARGGRRSWGEPALLFLSLASPLVFGVAVSVLSRLATRDAYHGEGVVPYLPAVLVQLLISLTYSFVARLRPRAGPRPAEAA